MDRDNDLTPVEKAVGYCWVGILILAMFITGIITAPVIGTLLCIGEFLKMLGY